MTDYPPPPQAPQPPAAQPLSESDEKLWSVIAHAGVILFGIIPPLVVWLVFRDRSAFVNEEAKEALNWSILATIGYVVGLITTFLLIGFLILAVVGIAVLVLGIMAAVKVSSGEHYRYPLNWRIVK
ncbi:DUF4870 domain-containing protein [Demequina lignilytica]|uniref:DUF4870 domain-containing protein n=1 Tax=Demequina lignilytica TaxID=3051663 RepID=A0AB35MF26_9MICO|nr:DUF4870 domain-containing protein [Demequina sp. SYSU T0a273]MDN4482379.1 DUF4870 domain-containing protein [Demequina sp. SYSU T0a273]